MTCCGFFLVTNVLIVSCFGQKCLLNAINVKVLEKTKHMLTFKGHTVCYVTLLLMMLAIKEPR